MADVIETVDKAETIVILVLIGVGVYVLYQASQDFSDWINNLFGLQGAADTGNTYANAAQQSVAHPINTAGTIVGGWWNDLFGSGGSSSVAGYSKIGASGQHYKCQGSGADTDKCYPVTIDANGNELVSGVPVPASQAN